MFDSWELNKLDIRVPKEIRKFSWVRSRESGILMSWDTVTYTVDNEV